MSGALEGRTVLITRRPDQAGELSELLESHGARTIVLPTLRYCEPEDDRPLRRALERIASYSWVVYTSVHAVECVLGRIADPQALAGVRVAAVGPRTAAAVEAAGLAVDLRAERSDAASLAEGLEERLRPGDRVLYPRAHRVSLDLGAALRARGYEVDDPVAYRVAAPDAGAPEVARLLSRGDVHWIVAYSGSALRHLAEMLGDAGLLRRARLATIGPATSREAQTLGFSVDAEASAPDARSLVKAMLESD